MQFEAELYNGSVERGEGSGFLIGDAIIITDSHVIPRLADYRKVTLVARLGRRDATPISATMISRDPDTDVAVLQLAMPQPSWQPPCPIVSYGRDASSPLGTNLVVLGYPVGKSFSVTGGLLSNQDLPGRWQTDATMNIGNSGGPVFDVGGHLLGFAVAGMTWYGDGDSGTFVSGVNFFVPVRAVMASAVASQLQQPPSCWNIADADNQRSPVGAVATTVAPTIPLSLGAPGATSPPNALPTTTVPRTQTDLADTLSTAAIADFETALRIGQSAIPSVSAPPASASDQTGTQSATPSDGSATASTNQINLLTELNRQVPVSWMKDDHNWLSKSGRDYSLKVLADAGYRIETCEGEPTSANNASAPSCTIALDGKSAVFRTRLTSGPAYDRWRGWWHGQIALTQRLQSQ